MVLFWNVSRAFTLFSVSTAFLSTAHGLQTRTLRAPSQNGRNSFSGYLLINNSQVAVHTYPPLPFDLLTTTTTLYLLRLCFFNTTLLRLVMSAIVFTIPFSGGFVLSTNSACWIFLHFQSHWITGLCREVRVPVLPLQNGCQRHHFRTLLGFT